MTASHVEGLKLSPLDAVHLGVEKFRAARLMGQTAVNLREQATQLDQGAEQLVGSERLIAPEGSAFVVRSTAFGGSITVERLSNTTIGEDLGWKSVNPGDKVADDSVFMRSEVICGFQGSSVQCDENNGQIWVYTQAGDMRALYGDNTRLNLEFTEPY